MPVSRTVNRNPDAPKGRPAGERRCIVSGAVLPRQRMIRFVLGPGQRVVPDFDEGLPGRGMWVEARRAVLAQAASGRAFSRAMRGPVDVSPDLVAEVESALVSRALALIGLARRAGAAVSGFEKVRGLLRGGKARLLITATDGAAEGRRKLGALAAGTAQAGGLASAELGPVFGRPAAVHAAVTGAAFADRIGRALERLAMVREDSPVEYQIPDGDKVR